MINVHAMFGIIYEPGRAFEKLKNATALEGIILFAVFSVLLALIGGALLFGFGTGLFLYVMMSLTGFVIIAVLTALLMGAFGAKKNIDNTIGILGYASIITFLGNILAIIIEYATGITPAVLSGSNLALMASDKLVVGGAVLSFIVYVLFNLWQLIIGGMGVGKVCKGSTGRGIISFFLAQLIWGMILGAIVGAGIMVA
jgi:hypothetical protein